jgi:hypothetical protein
MAVKGEIHFPPNNKMIRHTEFVAFGRADKDLNLHGYIYDKDNKRVEGQRIHWSTSGVSSKRKFWVLLFTGLKGEKGPYTLKVFHVVDKTEQLLDSVTGLKYTGGYGGIGIAYPTEEDNPIPSEFGTYGTSSSGGAVYGTVSNVESYTSDQVVFPPNNWALQMSVTNPAASPATCTLTVWQVTGGSQAETGLEFQVVADPPSSSPAPPAPPAP